MNRITVELPEWAEGKHIYVFAGIELLAYRRWGEPLRVKVGRCNMCGQCCVIRGVPCEHLVPDGRDKMVCDHGVGRPFSCCIGVGSERACAPDCVERFEDA